MFPWGGSPSWLWAQSLPGNKYLSDQNRADAALKQHASKSSLHPSHGGRGEWGQFKTSVLEHHPRRIGNLCGETWNLQFYSASRIILTQGMKTGEKAFALRLSETLATLCSFSDLKTDLTRQSLPSYLRIHDSTFKSSAQCQARWRHSI